MGAENGSKGIKKFLYYLEILAVVFELEKETSKPIRNQAAPREFVGRPTVEWRRKEGERALRILHKNFDISHHDISVCRTRRGKINAYYIIRTQAVD